MRFQSSQANCGPAALYNAGCALGRDLSLEECERVCGTTTDGTSAQQLKRGAKVLGLTVYPDIRESNPEVALLRLRDALARSRTAAIIVDHGEHWVTVIGELGERFLVADGADNELVLSYTHNELLERWAALSDRKPYYAAVVA